MSPDIINMDEDFMNSARLDPENISFAGKARLKKSPEDLPESQVEYLSIAWLENDLSAEQIKELELCLDAKIENRAIFEAVRKTKLAAPAVTFKNRNSLKKPSAGTKVLRIVSISLSVAAAITMLILARIFILPLTGPGNNEISSEIIQGLSDDTLFIPRPQPILAAESINPSPYTKNRSAVSPIINEPLAADITAENIPEFVPAERETISLAAIPGAAGIEYRVPAGFLMASNNKTIIPSFYDDRSRVERFVAGIFRERVLRDTINYDAPLRPFEIAVASIGGLNKLLDWNMELRGITDEDGEMKSVSFSSALLSFNTPVRKTGE